MSFSVNYLQVRFYVKFFHLLKARGGVGVQPFLGVLKQLRLILKWISVQNCCFLPFVNSKLGSQDIVCTKWGPVADFQVFLYNLIIEN